MRLFIFIIGVLLHSTHFVFAGDARISFVTFSPIRWDVFYFDSPNSQPRRLSTFEGLNYDPVISPDGKWVVFTSEQFGNPHLFVKNLLNDAPPRLLIESEFGEDQATFSNDGLLGFVSTKDGQTNIYTVPFDPTRVTLITEAKQITKNHGGNFRPTFSPDGNIAFSSDFGIIPRGLVVSRLRGGNLFIAQRAGILQQLTSSVDAWNGSPVYSNDGESLFYYSDQGMKEGSKIIRMNLKTSETTPLTDEGQLALSPALTADQSLVYMVSERTRRLFPMYPTPGKPENWVPDWRMESISLYGNSTVLTPTVKNCWIPKFAASSPAFVCFGAPQVASAETAVPEESTQIRPGYPFLMKLTERLKVFLYSIKGYAAVLHPSRDAVLSSEPPHTSSRQGFVLVDRCLQKSKPDSIFFEGDPLHLPFNTLSVSPDGKWLNHMRGALFGEPSDKCEVWRTALDGSGKSECFSQGCPANNGALSIAEDGDRFVYRSGRGGTFDIVFGKRSTHSLRKLTNNGSRNTFPAISPDGTQVAYSSDRAGETSFDGTHKAFDIFLLNITPEGEVIQERQVTESSGHNAHVQFSPDGKWLVYASEMGGLVDEELVTQTLVFNPQMYGEIYVYNIETGEKIRLTHSKWENGAPTWVPPIESPVEREDR